MSDAKVLRLKEQEFRCIPQCPPGVLFDLADAEDGGTSSLKAFRDFMFTLVEDDEHERLNALLRDRRDPPSFADLEQAIGELVKAYSGRPTERPSRSPTGVEATGGPSRVVSLSRGTVRTVEASLPDGESAVS